MLAIASSLAVPVRADPLKKLARTLQKGIPSERDTRIAVLDFQCPPGTLSDGCSIVRERFTTYLAATGKVRVIERSLLRNVLQELKLEASGLITPEQTHRIGEVLGADAVVAGTLHDLDDGTTEVNARLIHTESARILSAGLAILKRTWQSDRVAAPARPRASLRKPLTRTPEHVEKEQLLFFQPRD
jgi:TolB-like protein